MASHESRVQLAIEGVAELREALEIRYETATSVAARLSWTVIVVAAMLVGKGCYEAKRRYDIIEGRQAKALASARPVVPAPTIDGED